MELLIATKNKGKVKELADLLEDVPVKLRSLNDFPEIAEPEENGQSFADNAILKARYYARQTNLWSLADDSGLEVEALHNAPGVFSARYAGPKATDAEKIEKLLGELNENDNRRARFVCVIAIADERGRIKHLAEGVCEGEITSRVRGENGFGYDPIFVPEGFSQTFAEMSNNVKSQISHRARAINKIIAYLRGFTVI